MLGQLERGIRVEAGDTPEEYDVGVVLRVWKGQCLVRWERAEVDYWEWPEELRPEGTRPL